MEVGTAIMDDESKQKSSNLNQNPESVSNSVSKPVAAFKTDDGTIPQLRESTVDTNDNQEETFVATRSNANSNSGSKSGPSANGDFGSNGNSGSNADTKPGQNFSANSQGEASTAAPKKKADSARLTKTPTDLRGQVISGKYGIEEKLGEGGMGSVYQAFDAMTKRVVAIKLLNQDRAVTDEAWKRFQQEAHATSALDHANIVRIYDFNVCEDHGPYLVMDLIEGEPLSSLIARKGALDPQFVADIMIQVADGLQHAHEKGIVHRDLKPSNILVSAEVGQTPRASIVDFGIAKLQNTSLDDLKLTKTGEVFGSPLYMSPEQCLAMPLDKRSDIYSLGCVMYEALTGVPPFRGKNFGETVIKHTKEAPPAFAADLQIPNPLKKIVFCALEKQPADRYQSMAAVKKEILNFKKGQIVRVKQKRRFWKIALLVCLATIPITSFFTMRDAVKDSPEFISMLFMKFKVPQIVEWLVLPDDETRTALNAVKIALSDYNKGRYAEAEGVLKAIWDSNPDNLRNRKTVAWHLARALAQQGKFDEAEAIIRKTYTLSDWQVGHNLRFVGTTLKFNDNSPKVSRFFFQRSRDFFQKAKDPLDAAKSAYLLGTCKLENKEFDSAKEDLTYAIQILEKTPKEEVWINNCRDALKQVEAGQAAAGKAAKTQVGKP